MTVCVTNQEAIFIYSVDMSDLVTFLICLSLYVAVSHSYGYGLLDASAMVALAQNWTSVGPQHKCVINMLTEPR